MRRHPLRRLCGVALLLSALPVAAAAQATPEAGALAFGNAIKATDWAAAARLMYPGALRQLRDLFEPVMNSPEAGEIGQNVFGLASDADFATTPDTVLFAGLLRTMLTRDSAFLQVLRTGVVTPLGHVPGGGDTVFVVTRYVLTMDTYPITTFEVSPFLLENGRWWALLKADFTNMATMIRQAVESQAQ